MRAESTMSSSAGATREGVHFSASLSLFLSICILIFWSNQARRPLGPLLQQKAVTHSVLLNDKWGQSPCQQVACWLLITGEQCVLLAEPLFICLFIPFGILRYEVTCRTGETTETMGDEVITGYFLICN